MALATKKLSNYLETQTIADTATLALNVTGKRGFGKIIYDDNAGSIFFEFGTVGTFHTTSNVGFSLTKDTASSVNIYTESSDIIIQNLTGSQITVYYDLRSLA